MYENMTEKKIKEIQWEPRMIDFLTKSSNIKFDGNSTSVSESRSAITYNIERKHQL